MSYVDPGATESFVFRVRKTLVSSPTVHWFNTYEARFTELGNQADLDSLAAGLVEYEAALHFTTVAVDQVTISTWGEDAHPYNPESFVTTPFDNVGTRSLGGGEMLDLRCCLFVKRLPSSGRIGRLFYRGCLAEADVTSFAGTFALADAAARQTALEDALSAGGIASNLAEGLAQPKLALIGASQVTRFIGSFLVGGVAVVKLNHKYFDRA